MTWSAPHDAHADAAPPTFIACTSRRKALQLFGGGLLFVGLGGWLISGDGSAGILYGCFAAASGLVMASVSLTLLLKWRPGALTVDEGGIRDGRIGTDFVIPWHAVSDAWVGPYHSSFRLRLHDPSHVLKNHGGGRSLWIRANRRIGLPDIEISPYGLDKRAHDVMQALTSHHDAWRRRVTARHHTTAVIPPST